MKRAVVLSGGGTKGAYEFGVWKAIRKLGIDYQIVTGTSIGSINGALMAAGDFDVCERIWSSLTSEDFICEEKSRVHVLKSILTREIEPADVMNMNIKNGGLDNTPFIGFVHKNIDEERIRKSDCDYGLVTVNAHDRKALCLPKDEIPIGLLCDYVIASSSVYPIFPMHKIGNDNYIDGMYHDNLPIDLAAIMGAGEFIVVDLHTDPQHPNYTGRPYVTYITPSEDLGGMLTFDRERIDKNINMGYMDAMRTFGRYSGYVYSFDPKSLSGYERAVEHFNESCARGEAAINLNTKSRIKRAGETRRMFSMLDKYARGRSMGKEGYFLRGAEIAADICDLPHDKVWKMGELVDEVKMRVGSRDKYPDADFFLNKGLKLRKTTMELKLSRDSLYLMGCLYHAAPKEIDYAHMLEILSLMPGELAGALFLTSVEAINVEK